MRLEDFTEEQLETLSDPAVSLRAFGTVEDQSEGGYVRYDPHRITVDLQQTIVGYASNPPVDDNGYTRWLVLLGYRQGGKSTTAAAAFYPKVAYRRGWDAVLIADNQDRADYLFDRVTLMHERWEDSLKVDRRNVNEVRTFTTEHSQYRVLSGHGQAVGIGQSVSSFVGSEIPAWRDAGAQFSLIYPSMLNRKHAMMVLESTPFPLSYPSAQWYMDKCKDAKDGKARDLYAFFPFWDGLLNRRPWHADDHLTNDELRLMERYGPLGMTEENIAFMRFCQEQDPEIRRDPELFFTFYPPDDLVCWKSAGRGVIPYSAVARHHLGILYEKEGDYQEFQPPRADACYLICVDPTGYGTRDHAAFHVLEVWADEWIQAATFGANLDPEAFVDILIEVGVRFNNARIAVERNGVGVATIALLKSKGWKNLHYDKSFKPGIYKSNNDEWNAVLIDGLLDKLTLYDKDTVWQVTGYKNDKQVELSPKQQLLGGQLNGRRARHHWDKVSALMVGCACAPYMPTRHKPKIIVPTENVLLFPTYNQIVARERQVALHEGTKRKPGRRAIYSRRRRR